MNEYLTPQDVMQALKISRTTAYGYLRSGRLRYFKVGKLVRIKADDLQRFVEGKPLKNKSISTRRNHGKRSR